MIGREEAKERLAKDKELYDYSMRLLVSQLANLGVTLILAVISGKWWELLLFVFAFTTLRRFAGGYHCTSSRRCFFLSSAVMVFAVLGIVLLEQWIGNSPYAVLWIAAGELATGGFILSAAPVEAVKKPLDAKEKRVYGIRARVVCMIQLAACYLCLVWLKEFSCVIVTAHVIIAVSMLCAAVQRASQCADGTKQENPCCQGNRG